MDPSARLAKLASAAASRTGGKGTPRRAVKKNVKSSGSASDDKKLQATFKKLACQPITGIEEVNMFHNDGTVLHFSAPRGLSLSNKVHVSVSSNLCVVFGNGDKKELTELVPGILNQLGPDSLENLKRLAANYQQGAIDDDDQVPELVENFEQVSAQ